MRSSTPYVFIFIAVLLLVGYYSFKERPAVVGEPEISRAIAEPPDEAEPKKPVQEIIKATPPPKPELTDHATVTKAAASTPPPSEDELRAIAVLGGEEPAQEPVPEWELSNELLDDLVRALETDENGALLEFRERFHLSNVQLVDIRRHLQIKKRRTQDSDGRQETLDQIREDFRSGILDVLGQK